MGNILHRKLLLSVLADGGTTFASSLTSVNTVFFCEDEKCKVYKWLIKDKFSNFSFSIFELKFMLNTSNILVYSDIFSGRILIFVTNLYRVQMESTIFQTNDLHVVNY